MYSWTLLLPAGPLYTGLTDLRAQLVSVVDGSNISSAISAGFVEVGSNGDYLFTYAEYPSDQTVSVIFYRQATPSVTLGSVVMNPAELDKNVLADAYNARSASHVEDTAERHSQAELILMLMKSRQTAADTQTIYKTDGVTVFGTRTIETDEDALPVVGVA